MASKSYGPSCSAGHFAPSRHFLATVYSETLKCSATFLRLVTVLDIGVTRDDSVRERLDDADCTKGRASEALPFLDRLRSYPTTIFLDNNGHIKAVHSGFSGPATGAAHRELRGKFAAIIEELLAN